MLLHPNTIIKEVGKYTAGKKLSGTQYVGRIYLPEEWIGKKVRCILEDDYIQESAKQTE